MTAGVDLVARKDDRGILVAKTGQGGWAVDRPFGESRERAFAEVLLADTRTVRIEHKHDRKCRHTGNLCVEFAQKTGPSGIATTQSERWAFELLDDCWLLVPTKRLVEVHDVALARGMWKPTGDFGNNSSLFPPCWLIRGPHSGPCSYA